MKISLFLLCFLIFLACTSNGQDTLCSKLKILEEEFYDGGRIPPYDLLKSCLSLFEQQSQIKATCYTKQETSILGNFEYYKCLTKDVFITDLHKWKQYLGCNYTLDTLSICRKIALLKSKHSHIPSYVIAFELEERSGLVAHYESLGTFGMLYANDSIFQADIKKWKDYFKCIDK
jgi:hypothetical protein